MKRLKVIVYSGLLLFSSGIVVAAGLADHKCDSISAQNIANRDTQCSIILCTHSHDEGFESWNREGLTYNTCVPEAEMECTKERATPPQPCAIYYYFSEHDCAGPLAGASIATISLDCY